jgi:sulfonate transport system substrate-binding protein
MPTKTYPKKSAAALAAAGLLTLSAALAGCGSAAVAKDKSHPEWDKLTFTIADNGGDGSQELAKVSHAFDSAPYTIKFARFDFGPPLVAAVGDVPPITGAAKSLGFRVVGVNRSLQPSVAQENIIVPKGSPVKSIADLKGKKIAIPQGSSAHGLALNAIQSAGLSPKDVTFVFLSPADGQTAFSSGKVDAWAIWNPQSALAVEQGARVLVKGLPPLDQGSSYYVASEKSLDDPVRRAALVDVFKRLANEFAWGNKHEDDFVKAISKETGISSSDAKKVLPTFQRRTTAVLPADVTAEQKLADNFFNAGEIDTKVDFTKVVTNILPQNYDVG